VTRTELATALGLPETAPTSAIYAAVRPLLDVAERPGGIDPGEVREAEVSGHRFRFGFVPRRKVIFWEGELARFGHEAALVIGVDAAAAFSGDEQARERFAAQLHSAAWSEHYTRLADIRARRHEVHREIVRYGVRGWDPSVCPTASESVAIGRDSLLTEESVDRLEARGLGEPLALAVLRHWTLTAAEKKS